MDEKEIQEFWGFVDEVYEQALRNPEWRLLNPVHKWQTEGIYTICRKLQIDSD